MLVGTANLETLAASAPTIESFQEEAVDFGQVVCLQVTAEMRNQAREAVLPSSLHPTIPPAISIQAWQVTSSPWGEFTFVFNRVSCRSGVRARGFTTAAFCSSAEALSAMTRIFGFPVRIADISFRHGYDGADLTVTEQQQTVLQVSAVDPEPMGLTDVQYTGTLNLAHTPNGLRLVQVEVHRQAEKVDRLNARLLSYNGTAMGNELLDPYRVVSASVVTETIDMPAIRFVCKADELAFTGTEPVKR